MGCDFLWPCRLFPWSDFNPRTRVGCDQLKGYITSGKAIFQSTHPCGVRRRNARLPLRNGQFQSTHPCGVRQFTARFGALSPRFQSTHPCGVRLASFRVQCWGSRFQSTHPCGVRLIPSSYLYHVGFDFNPRTRVGCDDGRFDKRRGCDYFNPHTCVGCDAGLKQYEVIFQSTHPCGVRL